MTEAKKKHPTHALRPTRGHLTGALFSILTLFLVLGNAELAVVCMNKGLKLCVTALIPALFPFLVISDLIMENEAIKPLGKLVARPFRFLFGVSENGSCVLILGWICGFPIGTKAAVTLYRQGAVDRQEFSRLLTFVNLPSSAFLLGTVGVSLFADRSFGIALYVVSLLSAVLIGSLGNFLTNKKKTQTASASFFRISDGQPRTKSSIHVFTDSVGNSAIAMLRICAFVVFFSVLVGTLENLTRELPISEPVRALMFGFFEMTGGTARAASLSSPLLSEILCMFFVGWSGLSVHCQMMSLCVDIPISYRPYIFAKATHGLLNALLWFVFRCLFG